MKAGAYQASPAEEVTRRSIYMYVKRSLAVPLMTVFDCCDNTTPAGRRDVTTVAPQALTLMNNAEILQESQAIAARLPAQANLDAKIQAAWQIVLSRDPQPHEVALARQHLASVTTAGPDPWTSLCHVLINTNDSSTSTSHRQP